MADSQHIITSLEALAIVMQKRQMTNYLQQQPHCMHSTRNDEDHAGQVTRPIDDRTNRPWIVIRFLSWSVDAPSNTSRLRFYGIGDGSYVLLEEKPLQNGYAFYDCRENFYAEIELNIQAIWEHRVIFMADGHWVWTGRVFKNSHLWRHRTLWYFDTRLSIKMNNGKVDTRVPLDEFFNTAN
ncbi:hypothetical protein BDR05DRAFT_987505 [Suillus weaverae]|nr:hypothetical protein BDR05DRAFT_987505 [Suillus weaverae]